MTSTLIFQSSLLALNKDLGDDVIQNGHVSNGDVKRETHVLEKIPTNVFVDRLIASSEDESEDGLSEGEMEEVLLEGGRHVAPKQRHSAKMVRPLEMEEIGDDETQLDVKSGEL